MNRFRWAAFLCLSLTSAVQAAEAKPNNAESGPQGKLELPKGQKHTVAWTGGSWSVLENTPFRLFKHFEHEGGISTPGDRTMRTFGFAGAGAAEPHR